MSISVGRYGFAARLGSFPLLRIGNFFGDEIPFLSLGFQCERDRAAGVSLEFVGNSIKRFYGFGASFVGNIYGYLSGVLFGLMFNHADKADGGLVSICTNSAYNLNGFAFTVGANTTSFSRVPGSTEGMNVNGTAVAVIANDLDTLVGSAISGIGTRARKVVGGVISFGYSEVTEWLDGFQISPIPVAPPEGNYTVWGLCIIKPGEGRKRDRLAFVFYRHKEARESAYHGQPISA